MNTETRDNFAVFILTHGRPNNVITYRTLEKQGYTGLVYIIIDNEDDTADEYRRIYDDKVIMFDKLAISETFDTGDNFDDRRTIVYARNACFEIAEGLGIEYFLQLDDDYQAIYHKYDARLRYKERKAKNLDKLFFVYLQYFKNIGAVSVAMAQNGDFIGGQFSAVAKILAPKRKCMNSFFCSTSRRFQFVGRVNEDVNTYTSLGNKGPLMLTLTSNAIKQPSTQSGSGGMTDLYLNEGTYIKSFYTVMYMPSCTVVADMGDAHRRLHHRIKWNHAVPRIVEEEYRKVMGDYKNV